VSFAPGFAVSPEIFFPQSDSDGTPVCVPDEDFFFYLRPMPAYMGALSILVGIGAGPQIPQSYESDPWQAPVIQQTQNVVAFTPPDQGDMAWLTVALDDGYCPPVVEPWANYRLTLVVGSSNPSVAITPSAAPDEDYYAPRIIWPDANVLRSVWDDAAIPIPAIPSPPDDGYSPPLVRPAPWGKVSVLVGSSNPSLVPVGAPIIDEDYAVNTQLPWPELTTIIGAWGYANSEDVAFPPVPAEDVHFIPRIVWPSWTPTRVVYDDAQFMLPAVPLLVEWQEWQRPIIWPEGPPLRVLQPWLNEPSNWFLPFSLHAALRVTDLGDNRYIVTDEGGNRYLVRDWGLPRYGVSDV